MRKRFAVILSIFILGHATVLSAGVRGVRQTADLAGPWVLSAVVLGEPMVSRVTFNVAGEKLSGGGLGDLIIVGTVRDAKIEFGLWT